MNPTINSTGYIYFIRATGTNKVKIGYSISPRWRLATLQTGSPLPLEIIGLCSGSLETEARFHSVYAEYHSHGEWFDLPDDAIAAIREDYKTSLNRVSKSKQPISTEGRHLLLALELSDSLAKVIEAGMIEPTLTAENLWGFPYLKYCPQHQMVLLPVCPGCATN